MENITQWIVNYIPQIISIVLAVICLIVSVVSNPKGIAKQLLALSEKLPAFINEAEAAGFVDGSKKLEYVYKLAIAFLSTQTGRSIEKITKYYGELITSYIENILSTPQKHTN